MRCVCCSRCPQCVSPLFDSLLKGSLRSGLAVDSRGIENMRTVTRAVTADWRVIADPHRRDVRTGARRGHAHLLELC